MYLSVYTYLLFDLRSTLVSFDINKIENKIFQVDRSANRHQLLKNCSIFGINKFVILINIYKLSQISFKSEPIEISAYLVNSVVKQLIKTDNT